MEHYLHTLRGLVAFTTVCIFLHTLGCKSYCIQINLHTLGNWIETHPCMQIVFHTVFTLCNNICIHQLTRPKILSVCKYFSIQLVLYATLFSYTERLGGIHDCIYFLCIHQDAHHTVCKFIFIHQEIGSKLICVCNFFSYSCYCMQQYLHTLAYSTKYSQCMQIFVHEVFTVCNNMCIL